MLSIQETEGTIFLGSADAWLGSSLLFLFEKIIAFSIFIFIHRQGITSVFRLCSLPVWLCVCYCWFYASQLCRNRVWGYCVYVPLMLHYKSIKKCPLYQEKRGSGHLYTKKKETQGTNLENVVIQFNIHICVSSYYLLRASLIELSKPSNSNRIF